MPVQADIAALDALSSTDTLRFRWAEPQEARVQGVPVHWREFSSSIALFATAQQLAEHSDRFQRVIAYKSGILLTGMRADWHWLAEIRSAAGGSQGRISMLHINAQKLASVLRDRSDQSFPWLALNARQHFSQESVVSGRRMVQQVYGATLSADEITAYVQQHLRSAGWKQEIQTARRSGTQTWRRGSSSLLVASLSVAQGSAVFLQHIE